MTPGLAFSRAAARSCQKLRSTGCFPSASAFHTQSRLPIDVRPSTHHLLALLRRVSCLAPVARLSTSLASATALERAISPTNSNGTSQPPMVHDHDLLDPFPIDFYYSPPYLSARSIGFRNRDAFLLRSSTSFFTSFPCSSAIVILTTSKHPTFLPPIALLTQFHR